MKSILIALIALTAVTAQARDNTLVHLYAAGTQGIYPPDPPAAGSLFRITVRDATRGHRSASVQVVADGQTMLTTIGWRLYLQLLAAPQLDSSIITFDPGIYTISLDQERASQVTGLYRSYGVFFFLDTTTNRY